MKSIKDLTRVYVASIAGEILNDDYKCSPLIKGLAASVLKCFGHSGSPAYSKKKDAQRVFKVYQNTGETYYKEKEIELALAILNFKQVKKQ